MLAAYNSGTMDGATCEASLSCTTTTASATTASYASPAIYVDVSITGYYTTNTGVQRTKTNAAYGWGNAGTSVKTGTNEYFFNSTSKHNVYGSGTWSQTLVQAP